MQIDINSSRGSALIISLFVLLLMTILGLSAMQTTGMQERMAGNMNDRNLAFQAAESAIAQAQAHIRSTANPSTIAPRNNPRQASTWDAYFVDSGVTVSLPTDANYALASAPRYAIERVIIPVNEQLTADEALSETRLYRITARAEGGTSNAVVILQSTFVP